mmetsp:Transcript_18861/g.45424  ORF Transcript_18861/g.45424 Transcript_18861/m.45424 type:complete len:284 (+) Transcript_18861:431-1282(+)
MTPDAASRSRIACSHSSGSEPPGISTSSRETLLRCTREESSAANASPDSTAPPASDASLSRSMASTPCAPAASCSASEPPDAAENCTEGADDAEDSSEEDEAVRRCPRCSPSDRAGAMSSTGPTQRRGAWNASTRSLGRLESAAHARERFLMEHHVRERDSRAGQEPARHAIFIESPRSLPSRRRVVSAGRAGKRSRWRMRLVRSERVRSEERFGEERMQEKASPMRFPSIRSSTTECREATTSNTAIAPSAVILLKLRSMLVTLRRPPFSSWSDSLQTCASA